MPDLRAAEASRRPPVQRSLGTGLRSGVNLTRPTPEVPQLVRGELNPRDVIPQWITIRTKSPPKEGESLGLRLCLAVRERVPEGPTGETHRVRRPRAPQNLRHRRGQTELLSHL